jgi:hypothetical protein
LRPNQRANATRSLFIKPHVQHLVVVSFSVHFGASADMT